MGAFEHEGIEKAQRVAFVSLNVKVTLGWMNVEVRAFSHKQGDVKLVVPSRFAL